MTGGDRPDDLGPDFEPDDFDLWLADTTQFANEYGGGDRNLTNALLAMRDVYHGLHQVVADPGQVMLDFVTLLAVSPPVKRPRGRPTGTRVHWGEHISETTKRTRKSKAKKRAERDRQIFDFGWSESAAEQHAPAGPNAGIDQFKLWVQAHHELLSKAIGRLHADAEAHRKRCKR